MRQQIECDETGLTRLEQLAKKLPLPGLSLDEKTNVVRESLRRQIDPSSGKMPAESGRECESSAFGATSRSSFRDAERKKGRRSVVLVATRPATAPSLTRAIAAGRPAFRASG